MNKTLTKLFNKKWRHMQLHLYDINEIVQTSHQYIDDFVELCHFDNKLINILILSQI